MIDAAPAHDVGLKFIGNVPDETAHEGRRKAVDRVGVAPLAGAESGVKIIRNFFGGVDDDIVGQESVQSVPHVAERKLCARTKISHLTPGMDSGVGASGADDVDLFLDETLQSFLDRPLNRLPVILALPAGIRRAVVFHEKLNIPDQKRLLKESIMPSGRLTVPRSEA